ncbi:hypothetical protein GUJ93_ZPchr0458g22460 [Zizania palustris]|uniref:BHLH domain-containing protein n=1 Tax=Zizania palustris TaxID=103762 RepID=A0A8J5RD91_ZIZPA|nr:hypothetical protein GUJ93_ZPchr0458g22460 [Zizania palustris]
MGDHQMMHAAPAAMYNGGGSGGVVSQGAWWNTAVPAWSSALAASYDMAADNVVGGGGGGKAKSSATTASSESPGNNSSITFQEQPTSIADPAGGVSAAVLQPAMAGFTDWNQPFINSGAGLHEFLQDGHHDMSASSLMNPSSNNLVLMQQGHHEQQVADHHQLLSSFGCELLLSPTSPYGFQSSLLRSLMEPTAPAKPAALPGLQQYQYGQQMGQTPAAAARLAQAGARETLQFANDAPFWNPSAAGFAMAAAAAAPDQDNSRRSIKRSSPAPPSAAALALKTALEGVVGDSSSVIAKKVNGEPAFKKPRPETPSPLPTFKVRKEKLGDRITALQQLVSPFGKTDTASVLHETIEYIKFLHDQVSALSAPYLKQNGHQVHHLKSSSGPDKSSMDGEVSLKARGLCLVPISSTFAVASEVPVELWTPFGANFIRFIRE